MSFQAAADYCLTYSDDSSEGDYDPTRECFMVELGEHNDDALNDEANAPPVVPAAFRPATSANSGMQQAQLAQHQELEAKLEEEHRQSRSCVPHSSGSAPRTVRVLGRQGVSPRSESLPTTTSTTHWT